MGIGIILIFLFITISTANAALHTIDNDSQNINNVVNAINSDTDTEITLIINPGIYNKAGDRNNNITVNNKNITIKGNGLHTNIIINAQNSGRIFNITGNSNVTFINITFTKGFTTSDGGAIYKIGNGTLNIINCSFDSNTANRSISMGGAIFFTGCGDFSVLGSKFINNIAGNSGGAIFLRQNTENDDIRTGFYSYSVIKSDFIENNASSSGGAIFFQSPAYMKFIEIDFCKFIANRALYGGACSLNGGNQFIKVSNSVFENNRADKTSSGEGGAIEANENWELNIINCKFINNTATRFGGAISNYWGLGMTVINCSFINNTSPMGGAFYDLNSRWNEDTNIINSSFIGHDNAISLRGDKATITGCNFTDNHIAINITGNNTKIIGCNIINNAQGIFVSSSAINTVIKYNRIFNNTVYDLYNEGIRTGADYNWWGNNNPDNYYGIDLNNYFIMNIINLTSLNSDGTVKFQYTFVLNTGDITENNLLPYFETEVYINFTNGFVKTFDARFGSDFDLTLEVGGMVLYTFVTDNGVQTLEGIITKLNQDIPDEDNNEPDTIVFYPTPHPNETNTSDSKEFSSTSRDVNNTNDNVSANTNDNTTDNTSDNLSNNSVTKASMKKTGLPINLILIALCSVLGIIIVRKR